MELEAMIKGGDAEIERLRSEIDRLRSEIDRLNALVEDCSDTNERSRGAGEKT